MIRRTVARAFGHAGDERPRADVAPPQGQGGSRIALLNQIFTELQEAFERTVRERQGGAEGSPEGSGDKGPFPRITKVRPRPEGLEFLLEGPAGSFRFLNAMDGIVWIYQEEDGRFREDRLLSIQFEGNALRLIEKPAGAPRAPFRFTSLPQLVREFLPEPAR